MCDSGWVSTEFNKAPIRDKRLVKRLINTTKMLSEHSHASIPQSCGNLANTIGAYRLFDNTKITPEVVLMSHKLHTLDRIKDHETILLIQDTTYLDFSDRKTTEGLGLYSVSPEAKGILLHSTLATTTDGKPLGILSQEYWTREPKDPSRNHKSLPIEDKESLKWLNALEESHIGMPPGVKTITICDREADIYDLLYRGQSEGYDLLIRADKDRRIVDPECKSLIPKIENCPSAGEVIVTIPRNANLNAPKREARLSIKYSLVSIKPPKHRTDKKLLPNLELYAILAEEISDPPKGVKPIYWLLLTTLSIDSAEAAFEKVLLYKQRWKIERFHYTLKSGCKIEELQLESIDRLQNAIAVYSIIAWRLLWLTYETRESPDTPCDRILQKHEWQALYCFVNKTNIPPKKVPSMHEAVILIARLGGFLARKLDGEPGVTVLWRGMSRLRDISESWLIFSSPHPSNNVFND